MMEYSGKCICIYVYIKKKSILQLQEMFFGTFYPSTDLKNSITKALSSTTDFNIHKNKCFLSTRSPYIRIKFSFAITGIHLHFKMY